MCSIWGLSPNAPLFSPLPSHRRLFKSLDPPRASQLTLMPTLQCGKPLASRSVFTNSDVWTASDGHRHRLIMLQQRQYCVIVVTARRYDILGKNDPITTKVAREYLYVRYLCSSTTRIGECGRRSRTAVLLPATTLRAGNLALHAISSSLRYYSISPSLRAVLSYGDTARKLRTTPLMNAIRKVHRSPKQGNRTFSSIYFLNLSPINGKLTSLTYVLASNICYLVSPQTFTAIIVTPVTTKCVSVNIPIN